LALMDQAPVLDCQFFDLLPFCEDRRATPEVDVSGRQVAEALVIPVVVVVIDEGDDCGLKLALQVVVFQEDAVLEGLVPALDLALRLGVIGRTADVIHAVFFEVFGEIARDVAGPVVTEQSWLVQHGDGAASRCGQCDVEGGADIVGPCQTDFPISISVETSVISTRS
jgi:hypothetical protein